MREQNEKKEIAQTEGVKESDLVKINGIGKRAVEKLAEAGITTTEDLAESEASDFIKQKWIDSAIELI